MGVLPQGDDPPIREPSRRRTIHVNVVGDYAHDHQEDQHMRHPRTNLSKPLSNRNNGETAFKSARERLRSPEIDTVPSRSPLDALVRGLVSIGDKAFKGRPPMLRVP